MGGGRNKGDILKRKGIETVMKIPGIKALHSGVENQPGNLSVCCDRNHQFFLSLISLFLPVFLIFLAPFNEKAIAATEDEMAVLQMLYAEDELLIVSSSREEKPMSQVAENITVITKEEIESINAHTLVDVLHYIPGVQIDMVRGGPGSPAVPRIYWSEFRHVLVMVDDVPLNNLGENALALHHVPVQHIERIEIMKSPGSSAWGSSLGGVINIITKPPGDSNKINGTISSSYGEGNTGDFRGEISGKVEKLGFYIYSGKFKTDGLTPTTFFDTNNLYAKLKYDISETTNLLFTLGYAEGKGGGGEVKSFGVFFDDVFEELFSTLALNTKINENTNLSLSLRTLQMDIDMFSKYISTGNAYRKVLSQGSTFGGSAKITWKNERHDLVVGVDVDDRFDEANYYTNGGEGRKQVAVFANDTIRVGDFYFIPAIRFDHTNTNGDFWSPSAGVTYTGFEKVLFRANISRGLSIPPFGYTFGSNNGLFPNPELKMEECWSYYGGLELNPIKYLWLKAGYFRIDIRGQLGYENYQGGRRAINLGNYNRHGADVEVKTTPFFNISLHLGFNYSHLEFDYPAQLLDNHDMYKADIGILYDDKKSLKINIKGRFANRNTLFGGPSHPFVWDFFLNKKIYSTDRWSTDLFFSARNVLNNFQDFGYGFKNEGRWFEGGVRVKF